MFYKLSVCGALTIIRRHSRTVHRLPARILQNGEQLFSGLPHCPIGQAEVLMLWKKGINLVTLGRQSFASDAFTEYCVLDFR
jgi:hypothetical protein